MLWNIGVLFTATQIPQLTIENDSEIDLLYSRNIGTVTRVFSLICRCEVWNNINTVTDVNQGTVVINSTNWFGVAKRRTPYCNAFAESGHVSGDVGTDRGVSRESCENKTSS